jgi:chemotaxis methyl-accepting protein methylase
MPPKGPSEPEATQEPDGALVGNEYTRLLPDSQIDQAVYDIWGPVGLEVFNELHEAHPDWSQEELLLHYQERGTNPQTYFFREGNVKAFGTAVLPYLEAQRPGQTVRALEVGCSTGEESYSLATSALMAGHHNFHIDAIDVNSDSISTAKTGAYALGRPLERVMDEKLSTNMSREYIEDGYFVVTPQTKQRRRLIGTASDMRAKGYITRDDSGNIINTIPPEYYRVEELPIIEPSPQVRENVRFATHDIIDHPVDGQYDVVIANNVLSHFPEATRNRVMHNMLASLRPGGLLILEPNYTPKAGNAGVGNGYYEWRQQLGEAFGLQRPTSDNHDLYMGTSACWQKASV